MKKAIGVRVVHIALVFVMLASLFGSAVLYPSIVLAAKYSFSPRSGPPGTKVDVTVSGAPSGESLTVEGNGQPLCSFSTGGNGKGGCSFKVSKGSGNIHLKITGPNVGSSDIGTFKVTKDNDGGGGGDNGKGHNGKGNNGNQEKGRPELADRVGCGVGLTKGIAGLLVRNGSGLPSAALGCRKFVPDYKPVSPDVERAIDTVSCLSSAVGIGAGLTVGTLGTGALVGLGASFVGLQLCINKAIDQAGKDFLKDQGLDNILPVEELEPIPTGPSSLPALADPALTAGGLTGQAATTNRQAAEEIRTTVGQQVTFQSVNSVKEQQGSIRSDICTSLPAGAGGCP